MPRNNRYSYYDDKVDDKVDDKTVDDNEEVEESTEESTTTESNDESTEESTESVNEIIVIDPEVFGVPVSETDESKTDNRPIIDEERFIYHPEDGSITHRLDKDGCPYGYFWNELKGRCSPNSEKT